MLKKLEVLKAVGLSLHDAFFNGTLCDLLTSGEKQSKVVELVAENVLAGGVPIGTSDDADNEETRLQPPVRSIVKRIMCVCSALCSLLDPLQLNPNAKIEDVVALKESTSSASMETTMRALLTQQSAGGHYTDYYTLLCNDQIAKAATSSLAKEAFLKLVDLFEKGSDDFDMNVMKEAVLKLPDFRAKLRVGACHSLEEIMVKALKKMASNILSTDVVDLTSLILAQKGLSLFTHAKGVPDLLYKLDECKKQHSKDMGIVLVKEALDECIPRDPPHSEDVSVIDAIDLRGLTKTLDEVGAVPADVPEDLVNLCTKALPLVASAPQGARAWA